MFSFVYEGGSHFHACRLIRIVKTQVLRLEMIFQFSRADLRSAVPTGRVGVFHLTLGFPFQLCFVIPVMMIRNVPGLRRTLMHLDMLLPFCFEYSLSCFPDCRSPRCIRVMLYSSVQIVFRKSRRLRTHDATSAMNIVKTTLLSLWQCKLF